MVGAPGHPHPQGASSDPRRHEGRCKDTPLPVPRGCLGCSKWGGYPLNSRQFQITLIGKMNKARNSRGIPPFQPSCLQDIISSPESAWKLPRQSSSVFPGSRCILRHLVFTHFVAHLQLGRVIHNRLGVRICIYNSTSCRVQEIGKLEDLEALSGSFLKNQAIYTSYPCSLRNIIYLSL